MNLSPPVTPLEDVGMPNQRQPMAGVPQDRASLSIADWARLMQALRLSPRESEIVLRMLVDEKESLIARHLRISSHTVHTHLERLYRKLRVNSRAGVVVRVLQAYVRIASKPAAP